MARPAIHANAAERQAAYRARQGRTVTVQLDEETYAGLVAYQTRQHMDGDCEATLSSIVQKLIARQLLRRR